MFEHERAIRPILAGIVLVCFLMPFCEITCGGQRLASISGTDLVMGKQIKPPDMFGNSPDKFGFQPPPQNQPDQSPSPDQNYGAQSAPPMDSIRRHMNTAGTNMPDPTRGLGAMESTMESQPTAVAAFALAVLALIAALLSSRGAMKVSAVCSGLVAVALFVLKTTLSGDLPSEAMGIIDLKWTTGFWVALLGSAILAVFTARVVSGTDEPRHKPRLVIQTYTDPAPTRPAPPVSR